jgi:CRISPR/Cas system-associated endonuclease Cas3-HD
VFHDLGKGFCKSFFNHEGKEQRYASYLGHENTSCYLAMHYLINIGYELEFVLDVAKLISYHMLPKNMSSKVEKKLKNWLDEESFEELLLFNDYDNAAK